MANINPCRLKPGIHMDQVTDMQYFCEKGVITDTSVE